MSDHAPILAQLCRDFYTLLRDLELVFREIGEPAMADEMNAMAQRYRSAGNDHA